MLNNFLHINSAKPHDTISEKDICLRKTFYHGLTKPILTDDQASISTKPFVVAHDPVQSLFAVASSNGVVKLFGKPGFEQRYQSDPNPRLIFFIINKPILIIIGTRIEVRNILTSAVVGHFTANENIRSIAHTPNSTKIYLGTEGCVCSLDIESFTFESMVVSPLSVGLSEKSPVIALQFHPIEENTLLIGYENSAIVEWDIQRRTLLRYYPLLGREGLTTLYWHPKGKRFLSGYANGEVCVWKRNNKFTTAQIQSRFFVSQGELRAPIEKLIWTSIKGQSTSKDVIIIEGGGDLGKPCGLFYFYDESSFPLVLSDEHISDFVPLFTSPWLMEATDPVAIFSITTEGTLKVNKLLFTNTSIDVSDIEVPPNLDIKLISSTTKIQHCVNCPSEFFTLKSLRASYTDWPLTGGSLSEEPHPRNDLLVTAHSNGDIMFWDVSSTSLEHLYTLKIEGRWKEVGYGASIQTFQFCPLSREIVISCSSGHTYLYGFRPVSPQVYNEQLIHPFFQIAEYIFKSSLVCCISISYTHQRILMGDTNGFIYIFNLHGALVLQNNLILADVIGNASEEEASSDVSGLGSGLSSAEHSDLSDGEEDSYDEDPVTLSSSSSSSSSSSTSSCAPPLVHPTHQMTGHPSAHSSFSLSGMQNTCSRENNVISFPSSSSFGSITYVLNNLVKIANNTHVCSAVFSNTSASFSTTPSGETTPSSLLSRSMNSLPSLVTGPVLSGGGGSGGVMGMQTEARLYSVFVSLSNGMIYSAEALSTGSRVFPGARSPSKLLSGPRSSRFERLRVRACVNGQNCSPLRNLFAFDENGQQSHLRPSRDFFQNSNLSPTTSLSLANSPTTSLVSLPSPTISSSSSSSSTSSSSTSTSSSTLPPSQSGPQNPPLSPKHGAHHVQLTPLPNQTMSSTTLSASFPTLPHSPSSLISLSGQKNGSSGAGYLVACFLTQVQIYSIPSYQLKASVNVGLPVASAHVVTVHGEKPCLALFDMNGDLRICPLFSLEPVLRHPDALTQLLGVPNFSCSEIGELLCINTDGRIFLVTPQGEMVRAGLVEGENTSGLQPQMFTENLPMPPKPKQKIQTTLYRTIKNVLQP